MRSAGRQPPRGSCPRLPVLLAGLALLVLVAAVFLPLSRAEFLNYDDDSHVVKNPHVASGVSAANLRWALTTFHKANWMPLTWLSHQFTVQLFGMRPGAHHLVNLALHAANTLLLLLALRALTGALWRSAAVAALFAVHPLHVESVAWVAERKDVLSTLLLLLGLLAYRRYAARPGLARYLPVAGALALGLASKPMLVTFPFLLLLLDYWPLGRLRGSPRAGFRAAAPLLLEKAPLLLLAAGAALLTLLAQGTAGAMGSAADTLAPGLRLANALVSGAAYLVKTVRPVDLAVHYPYPTGGIPLGQTGAAAALLLGVSVAAGLAVRRAPWAAVGWLWYLGALVPVIGLVQVGSQAMADRYTYVPLTGIFLAAVWSGAAPARKSPRRQALLGVALLAVLLPLAVLARRQAGLWRDAATLFAHAAAAAPPNAMAEIKLGDALAAGGRAREALVHYRRARAIAPAFPEVHYDVGLQLEALGDFAGAAAAYGEALRLAPGYLPARLRLGIALAQSGRHDEAIAQYREILRSNPGSAETHYHLGVDLAAARRYREAAQAYREALRLEPAHRPARANLEQLRRRGLAD